MNYETDIIAWAQQQSQLLRTQQFDLLDIEHIAEELEDVGKSEQRELAHRMTVLIAHLLKWQFQPERRGRSWQLTIRHQRRSIQLHLKQVPSLKIKLNDSEWLEMVWGDAVYQAMQETRLEDFSEFCTWSVSDILSDTWLPAK
jgi:seryl-tRNA(Sec) selenium transferase